MQDRYSKDEKSEIVSWLYGRMAVSAERNWWLLDFYSAGDILKLKPTMLYLQHVFVMMSV